MSINLDHALTVLTAGAFAVILLAPKSKLGEWSKIIVGGACALLFVLLLIESFSASA